MDDVLLTNYCNAFFGFGCWMSPIWFIGIEEAGGRNVEDVQKRLRAWDENGRKPLEDAPRFYPMSGNVAWHGSNAIVQSTWRQLIRMLLLARGQTATDEALLDYQRNHLGEKGGETCLVELLPLPSPTTAHWNYAEWSTLRWLQSRDSYVGEVRARRENKLRQQINEHKPQAVIFYGSDRSLRPSWQSIAGGNFEQAIGNERILLWRANANTAFFITRHPVAESNEYFEKIGKFLHNKHGSRFQS